MEVITKPNGVYKIKAIEGDMKDLLVFEKIAWEGRAYSFRFKKIKKKAVRPFRKGLSKNE